jgi:translocator protein
MNILYGSIIIKNGSMKDIYMYGIAALSVIATSAMGTYFTNKSVRGEWYKCIQPAITPPPIVFPIVWTVLYALLAYAFGRALIKHTNNKELLMLFVFNLALNVVWCYLYFHERNPHYSFLFIVTLWVSIVAIMFNARDTHINYALAPYLVWISFATLLNGLSMRNVKKCEDIA